MGKDINKSQRRMRDDVKRVFEPLAGQVVHIHFLWATYVDLFGKSQARIRLLNATDPSFFKQVEESFRDQLIIGLWRLIDKTHGTLTLHSLVHAASPCLTPGQASQLNVLVEQITAASAKIKDVRHGKVAHLNKQFALREQPRLLGPSRLTFTTVLGLVSEAMNLIEKSTAGMTTLYEAACPLSARMILILKKAKRFDELVKEGRLAHTEWSNGEFARG